MEDEKISSTRKHSSDVFLNSKFDIRKHFSLIQPELEQTDARILQQTEAFDPAIRGYVEYAITSQGQRIRPALCMLAANATGGVRDDHYNLSIIIELIHLASLVHDDILDDAQIRRTRLTSHAKWGVELSVLLGDCLFAHALRMGVQLSQKQITQTIADAVGEVCAGEMIQTQRRFDLNFSVTEYFRVIEMKTAALFRIASGLAGAVNEAPEAWQMALTSYGNHLGIAYQIYDDCLDLLGAESLTGKTLGTDLSKGKWTLPLLHVLHQLDELSASDLTEMMLANEEPLQEQIIQIIIHHGGHIFAARKAQEHLQLARRALAVLPDTHHRQSLDAIAASLHDYMNHFK
ncbi:MAG: polyprenyl synthetase family protein [Verrucomicrobiota bacterium]